MPELCQRPVFPGVDVQVGEDQGVEGTILRRPLHHGLEPSCRCCDSHSWERPHCPVCEFQWILRWSVDNIGHQLVANEDIANQLGEAFLALLDLGTSPHVFHPHPGLHRSPHHCCLLLLLLSDLALLLLLLQLLLQTLVDVVRSASIHHHIRLTVDRDHILVWIPSRVKSPRVVGRPLALSLTWRVVRRSSVLSTE